MADLINDLIAEQSKTDVLVSGLTEEQWNIPIPDEETWTIKDAIVHIALYDYGTCEMLKDSEENVRIVVNKEGGTDEYKRSIKYRDMKGCDVLDWWRKTRTRMVAMFMDKNMKDKVNWAPGVPPMSVRSLLTARQMEMWAHSVDVRKALGVEVTVDDSITSTLFLSWQARANAYRINGFALPETPMYLELTLPSGELWTKGDKNDENYIVGDAKDWAMTAVRRINWRDASLVVHGGEAERYADIVQTYAGEAEAAPPPKKA